MIEQTFGSTTWVWKRVQNQAPAQGQSQPSQSEVLRVRLAKRHMRRKLSMTIKLRGGEECWVEVEARGRVWRFPGVTAVYDVLRVISQQ